MAIAGTIGAPSSEERGMDLRTVTTVTAAALAIADMIGIGVFTSLGFQVQGIPSAFAVLMLWIVGGVAALCGALSYGELAAALPRSGGEYNFLSHIYGRGIGFVAGWISATVGFAAPVALAAMAFGGYFDGIAPGALGMATVEVFSTKVSLIPIGVVWLVGLIHLSGVALGSTFEPGVLKAIGSLGSGSMRRISGEQGPVAVALELLDEITRPPVRDLKVEIKGWKTARVYHANFIR